jgi:YaaC-like Protein
VGQRGNDEKSKRGRACQARGTSRLKPRSKRRPGKALDRKGSTHAAGASLPQLALSAALPDYKDIKFLESTDNLREIVSSNSGRELSLERSNQISVCLEQGRLLFEAAQNVGWEIKPLLVYYGMVGFAKAIYLARNLAKLESLPPRHGLTDISESPLIAEMTVKIDKDGTFQCLNDSCADLEKLVLYDKQHDQSKINHSTCKSEQLIGKEIGLKQVLARIPGLQQLYHQTFQEEPGVLFCTRFRPRHDSTRTIQFDVLDCLSRTCPA